MKTLTARPKLLKQANLSLIRNVIKNKRTATRAEIVNATKISSTTVRTLLSEMMESGEIESIGYDESSGGRKAERYRFKPDKYYSVAFCITDNQIHSLLINVSGEILEVSELNILDSGLEETIIAFLDKIILQKEIKSIGIGVPGVIEGGGYWRKNRHNDELYKVDIGDKIFKKYNIPVVLENDLNATTIGFGWCYQNHYSTEAVENLNMAYLHFEKGCVSAGFIAGGQIIRGCNNFAGELGLLLMDNERLLDECMAEPIGESQYMNLMVKIISWVCGILNPKFVALSGPDLRKETIGAISDILYSQLPKRMFAEILYSPDVWHDYHDGMAYLTAKKMFDEVQFRKE